MGWKVTSDILNVYLDNIWAKNLAVTIFKLDNALNLTLIS